METAVRKATRLDYNPPKQKHLQTLISLTFQSPGNAASIIDLLDKRLRENSWIIIFKVLIIIHTLMRLGDGEKVISYVETKPSALDTSKLREKSSGVVHIQNIYLYTAYLEQKVIAYRHLRVDYVKNTMGSKEGRLRHLSVKDGLLKETVVLQKQIGTLLKSNFILEDVDNNISLYAYRLLVEDLLVLFQVINESIVNILEHYFAMDKSDARTSLEIYKRFAKQTEDTISFLDRARRLQNDLNISIPTVKHAPLSLAAALQEYLDDANKSSSNSKPQGQMNTNATPPPQQQQAASNTISFNTNAQPQPQQQQPKELIDFFASLENEKVNIFYNPVIQQQPQQPLSMFAPPAMIAPQPTGHNPFRTNTMDTSMQQLMIQPQQSTSSILPTLGSQVQQQQQANPFRASTMPQMSTSSPTPYFNHNSFSNSNSAFFMQQPPQPQQTLSSSNNPFALSSQPPQQIIVASPSTMNNNNPFSNSNVNAALMQQR
ncbi:ENTH-domain-containing protein [Mucor ambiguus]|uniref:ENTH-domain-containing protein n=1 Tax=Mucor ambiguus TaxID=91626 RepID=A0A0C9N4N1_9FUNG|nr:ENTH-domain-containing protein [Mucor ambiguus]